MAGVYIKPTRADSQNLLRIDVDPKDALSRQFSAIEQKHLPAALTRAVVLTAQEMQRDWAATMRRVFDRPTPFTLKAIRYYLKPGGFFAQIYVRDEAIGGTPPARYLMAQVTGGQRLLKPFEKRLKRLQGKGVLPSGMQTVPGKGATLDAFGNIAGSQMNRILSQLGARRDDKTNESDASRGRRLRRERRKQGERGSYFVIPRKRGNMLPGIYQRQNLGGAAREATGTRSVARSILLFTRPGSYNVRFPIFERAEKVYRTYFPRYFEYQLKTEIELSRSLGAAR